ncbi:aminotransferase class III-fold pyridoxal phosphate-dependent enzyme [Saccharospirillum salsuginis]|uniref:Glutamate-1-semialdehyde 2,1-aminomutase n=1 Tax=Saccharospirillum salsuginis TaxID=418750 RepID=A0A918KB63_9GAMM|nr:aminotransferase class III-fold pyridoxal phosphate-dependent enzyme [Saccharospirillum salsuginis]GGX57563.1 hypothetical protein GCM10007392_26430 [Saccharospirillum salsuginis]
MLRHHKRSVIRVHGKTNSRLCLDTSESLIDVSGGSLTQSFSDIEGICNLTIADLNHIVPSAGFESDQKTTLQKRLISACGEQYADLLWASSGSDAIESAVWAANAYCKSKHDEELKSYIVRKGSYHGNTQLCRSLSMRSTGRSESESVLVIDECRSDAYKPHSDNDDTATFLNQLKEAVDNNRVCFPAALILEGKPTTGWKFNSSGSEFQEIITYCRINGIVVILDDVASGAYRHGELLSCGVEQSRILPDIAVIAKGLTSGVYPLSCVLLSDEVTNAIQGGSESPLTFTHGLTEVAAVIANNCLDRYQTFFNSAGSIERRHKISHCAQQVSESLVEKGIGISTTPTTLRLDMNPECAKDFFEQMKDHDMWAYIGTSLMKVKGTEFTHRKYAHICPAFDMDNGDQDQVYNNLINVLSNL